MSMIPSQKGGQRLAEDREGSSYDVPYSTALHGGQHPNGYAGYQDEKSGGQAELKACRSEAHYHLHHRLSGLQRVSEVSLEYAFAYPYKVLND